MLALRRVCYDVQFPAALLTGGWVLGGKNMSEARLDTSGASSNDRLRAIQLLKEALQIVDRLGHRDIGARLQEVIDRLNEGGGEG